MPEACFLCLDSSEYMRNGDLLPNRMLAEQEAANLLVNAKTQVNAENTVGFLTMGGNACTVFETLTADVDRVMAALTNIRVGGTHCFFSNGLLIASLALSHRTNPRAEKRIIAFVGSPIHETPKELELLAKKLRKDDVAVDIVAFGVDENAALLADFVERVGKQGNSRLLSVPQNGDLVDALMSSPIMLGEDAFGDDYGPSSAAPAGGNAFHQFGVDPSIDPELAMALRMSMEEEEQRRAAAAAVSASATAPTEVLHKQTVATLAADTATTQQGSDLSEAELANMNDEELVRRALAMSLEEARAAAAPVSGTARPAQNEESEAVHVTGPSDTTAPSTQADGTPGEPNEDETFLSELQDTLHEQEKK